MVAHHIPFVCLQWRCGVKGGPWRRLKPELTSTTRLIRTRYVLVGKHRIGFSRDITLPDGVGRTLSIGKQRDMLAKHVDTLCEKHAITVLERTRHGGWAAKRQRTISIRPVKTQRTYIIALHEIGHIIGSGRGGKRLEQEAAAWEFVLQESIVILTPVSYVFVLKALDSYVARARRRRGMEVPGGEDPFWLVYRNIERLAGNPDCQDTSGSGSARNRD